MTHDCTVTDGRRWHCGFREKSEQGLYWVNNTLHQWKLNQQLLSARDSLSVSKINSQERVQMRDKILRGNYYTGSHKTFQKVLRMWRWVINYVCSVGKGGGQKSARNGFKRLWWGIELSPTGRMVSAVGESEGACAVREKRPEYVDNRQSGWGPGEALHRQRSQEPAHSPAGTGGTWTVFHSSYSKERWSLFLGESSTCFRNSSWKECHLGGLCKSL